MTIEITVMAVVGMLVGIPVVGMMVSSCLKPKPCEGLAPVLTQILRNQELFMQKVLETQSEIVESQRMILHYLDLMERRQKPD